MSHGYARSQPCLVFLPPAGRLAATGESAAGTPPPKITDALPQRQAVTRYLELTGATAAVNSADFLVGARGWLRAGVDYQDGAPVQRGTPLFTIEPEPYDVKLQQGRPPIRRPGRLEAGALADFDRQSNSG